MDELDEAISSIRYDRGIVHFLYGWLPRAENGIIMPASGRPFGSYNEFGPRHKPFGCLKIGRVRGAIQISLCVLDTDTRYYGGVSA